MGEINTETGKFPETKEFNDDFGIAAPDKILLKSNAKGDLQAEVRIGGSISDKEALNKILDLQEHAWTELKKRFPNLKVAKND